MIKTSVQQAIDEVKRQAAKYLDAGIPIGAYIHCEAILQSLLPVEQQIMCDVLDWAAHEGFVYVSDEKLNKKYWFKVGSEKEYHTTK